MAKNPLEFALMSTDLLYEEIRRMTDSHTKARTGKSQFFPLMPTIRDRLALGETYKQIHDDLTAKESIKIGYHQFSRYIRAHLKTGATQTSKDVSVAPP